MLVFSGSYMNRNTRSCRDFDELHQPFVEMEIVSASTLNAENYVYGTTASAPDNTEA